MRTYTYLICSVLAGFCGFLIGGFSGGAVLNMGVEYHLNSIAVVVIGSTSVAGGNANLPGLWGLYCFSFFWSQCSTHSAPMLVCVAFGPGSG